jgi:hypothetical protein
MGDTPSIDIQHFGITKCRKRVNNIEKWYINVEYDNREELSFDEFFEITERMRWENDFCNCEKIFFEN